MLDIVACLGGALTAFGVKYMSLEYWIIAGAFFFAGFLPGALVLIRETVKSHRQEVIRDLSAVFDTQADSGQRLIPSFEFVKFKYFIPTTDQERLDRHPVDHTVAAWLVALSPFLVVCGALCWSSFVVIIVAAFPEVDGTLFGLPKLVSPQWAYAGSAAFVGSYVMQIRELYRAINNFDLRPAMFVDSAITIVTGFVVAIIAIVCSDLLVPKSSVAEAPINATLILLSFFAGYMPQVTIRWLMSKNRLKNFKRENEEIYSVLEATPVELIDGINTDIRDRLADFQITSTQNLAAANPLMLFVETPYGVYQIMDWVAQAQLCASVGPKSVVALWKLGVRTLFDLERAALDPLVQNNDLLEAIGAAMFCDVAPPGMAKKGDPLRHDAELVRANIQMRLDDPHVHRLRQIYIQVGERIGPQNARFLTRNEANAVNGGVIGQGISFVPPGNITDPANRLGVFHVGDTIKVVGGLNDGRVGVVRSVSSGMLALENVDLTGENALTEIKLVRLNP